MLRILLYFLFISLTSVGVYNYSGPNQIVRQQKASVGEQNFSALEIEETRPDLHEAATMPFAESYADISRGVIGADPASGLDEFSDNVFQILLKSEPQLDDIVFLEYEATGVESFEAIVRSINGEASLGGVINANGSGKPMMLRERINPKELKEGINSVMFNLPEQTGRQVIVENVRLVFGNNRDQQKETQAILFTNEIDGVLEDNKILIRGFVGTNELIDSIQVGESHFSVGNYSFENLVNLSNEEMNRGVIGVKAFAHNGEVFSSDYSFSTNREASSLFEREASIYSSTVYTPGKTQIAAINGASILLSETALDHGEIIRVRSLHSYEMPSLPTDIVNVSFNGSAYRFLPDNTIFNADLKISIGYDPDLIPEGYTCHDIITMYYNVYERSWKKVEKDSVDLEGKAIVSKTNHFTDYINGIIKVPENPETAGYTPNTFNDYKVGDASSQIPALSIPSANNSGSLSTSFPIKIPQGRQGMQPQLSINYSSEGQGGWLGMGWDLPVSSISVDSRWGVPRYWADSESETYLLDGAQLIGYEDNDLAHRGFIDDVNGTKRFRRRIEGSFDKIERFGNSPSNYRWVVTNKDGTKYFYGGVAGVDESAVLQQPGTNNIAKWYLVRIEDSNKNTINYLYNLRTHGGVSDGQPGRQIYLEEINYTGFQDTPGKYKVKFYLTDAGTEPTVRQDINVSCNYGLKVVEPYRLERIDVSYQEQTIRTYDIEYLYGVYGKSLLKHIAELDQEGNEFYRWKMEYYDEVRNDDGDYVQFDDEYTLIDGHNDNIEYGLVRSLGTDLDRSSIIGGTSSEGWSSGIYVGVGPNVDNATKNLTVGYSYNYASSDSKVLNTLVDIDGDGLPDKVFDAGGIVKYRKNLFDPLTNTFSFSQMPFSLGNLSGIGSSHSSTHSHGPQASFYSFSAGLTWGKTKTDTKSYFIDKNGDRLLDVVHNNSVYFNQGNGDFALLDDDTPNPLYSVTQDELTNSNIEIYTQEDIDAMFRDNPIHDVVRVWTAPIEGSVVVNSIATLIEQPSQADYPFADGVYASVEKEGTIHDSTTLLSAGASFEYMDTINVLKDERIFFRLQSRVDGNFDKVVWNPKIEYLDNPVEPYDSVVEYDSNGQTLWQFDSREDFFVTGKQYLFFDKNNSALEVTGTFVKPNAVSDTIYLQVVHKDHLGVETIHQIQSIAPSIIFPAQDITSPFQLAVDSGDVVLLRAFVYSNINWDSTFWYPVVTHISDTISTVYKPIAERVAYNQFVWDPGLINDLNLSQPPRFARSIICPDSGSIELRTQFMFTQDNLGIINNTADAGGCVSLSVKNGGDLIARQSYNIAPNVDLDTYPLSFDVIQGDTIYIELTVANRDFYDSLKVCRIDEIILTGFDPSVADEFHDELENNYGISTIPPAESHLLFGPGYRNWGQFCYKADALDLHHPIEETELNYSGSGGLEEYGNNENIEAYDNPDDFNQDPSAGSLLNEVFIYMTPDSTLNRWNGYDNLTYITVHAVSSSRFGQDNMILTSVIEPDAGMENFYFLPDKVVRSSSTTKAFPDSWSEIPELAASAMAALFGVSLSFADTDGSSEMLMDMMDLNGDGFPDIISKNEYQYTLPGGHFFDETTPCDFRHRTESHCEGVSVGGSNSSVVSAVNTLKGALNKTQDTSKPQNSCGFTFGVSGSTSDTDDKTLWAYMDVNGDGLPDRVKDGGIVQLNIGYDFLPEENWPFSTIAAGDNISGSLGFDAGAAGNLVFEAANGKDVMSGSFKFGVSGSSSSNSTDIALMDINGDGLLDIIGTDDSLSIDKVRFNRGCGFSVWEDINGLGKLEAGSGNAESANGAITFSIPIIFIKISINPSGDYNKSINRTLSSFTDLNGDGVPDYIKGKRGDESMEVKFGRMGKTNLLKRVEGAFGASFTADYKRTQNTFDRPSIKWNLSSLKVTDGFLGDGPDTVTTRYEYVGGRYNRREKTEIGYYSVSTYNLDNNDDVYQIITQEYDSNGYYTNGLLLSTVFSDGQGNIYTKSINQYQMRGEGGVIVGADLLALYNNDATWAFPALVRTIQEYYEGGTNALLSHTTNLNYDNIGNVTQFEDLGSGSSDEYVRSEISYYGEMGDYIVNIPEFVSVKNSGNQELRYSWQDPDDSGNIIEIQQYLGDGGYASTKFEYDDYGNTVKVTYPANYNDSSMYYEYAYDTDLFTFNISVTDAFLYSSSATYDPLFGVIKQSVDTNGQIINYQYDNKGRTVSLQGPRELAAGQPFTIKVDYFEQAEIPYSVVQHYLEDFPEQPIETVTFVDGLFRPIQIKKTSSIHTGPDNPDIVQYTTSGKVVYDSFGRVIRTFHPSVQAAGTNASLFNEDNMGGFFTSRGYDILNRVLVDTLEDGSTASFGYQIENYDGIPCFKTITTDPLGNTSLQYADARQRELMQARVFGNGQAETKFEYNAISELLSTTDPLGNVTTYEYDKLGRNISYNHPDGGLTKYEYDLAGNLLVKSTANLNALFPDGGGINYEYTYNRLRQINYPVNFQNRVKYHYGGPGAPFNRVGRMFLQEDATGGQEFFFGNMGEVVKTVRTIVLSPSDMRTFVWEDSYDSWNRALTKTYADGEVLSYNYNNAGKLKSMASLKDGFNYEFIRNIGYNEFDERVHIAYGNGTETNYEYEPDRRRLLHVVSTDASGNQFMNYSYQYDQVSNILELNNDIQSQSNGIGGPTSFSYEYDDMYRLTHSSGLYEGITRVDGYELNMQYDLMGKIVNKQLTDSSSLLLNHHLNYSNSYLYDGVHPSAPSQIGSRSFEYDHNGNMTFVEETASSLFLNTRQMSWDEENRMVALSDNGYLNLYTYDASGERILKSHGGTQGLLINGTPVGFVQHSDNVTMYVSPDLVVNQTGFTKHYYVNGQRIASKTGTGEFNNSSFSHPIMTAGDLNYSELVTLMQNAAQTQFSNMGIPPGEPTIPNAEGYPAQSGQPIELGEIGEYANDPPAQGWPSPPIPLVYVPGVPPGEPTIGIPYDPSDSLEAGYLYTNSANTSELNQYFFHSDQVSSTNYVTDIFGEVRQHLEYIPFGETFIDEHTNSETSPYLFNGKELDETTGLYYYGARYYDPSLSIWVSVDPLADHPNQFDKSPYCAFWNNPIMYNDPDGQCPLLLWLDAAIDVGFVLYDAGVLMHEKVSTGKTSGENWAALGADGASILVPMSVGAGQAVKAGYKALNKVDNVADIAKTTSKVVENAKQGKQFESVVTDNLKQTGHKNVAEQVTVKPNGGGKNVRLDNVSTQNGNIKLTDAKSSATAPHTKNQKAGYPAIEKSGGTVVGNKGAAQGYPAGTKIPPTKVDIIRPKDIKQ